MNKNWFGLGLAVCLVPTLCAATPLMSANLNNEIDDTVQISYLSAVKEDNTLALNVRYDDAIEFEIAKDIVVSSDINFEDSYELLSVENIGGEYKYVFSCAEEIDQVYIENPVLYVPTEITPVIYDLNDTALKMVNNESWLDITSVKTENITDNVYQTVIIASPLGDELPRFPKLLVGDREIGGVSLLTLDENGDCTQAEFRFVYRDNEGELNEMINDMELKIGNSLIKTSAENGAKAARSTKISLPVITK